MGSLHLGLAFKGVFSVHSRQRAWTLETGCLWVMPLLCCAWADLITLHEARTKRSVYYSLCSNLKNYYYFPFLDIINSCSTHDQLLSLLSWELIFKCLYPRAVELMKQSGSSTRQRIISNHLYHLLSVQFMAFCAFQLWLESSTKHINHPKQMMQPCFCQFIL